MVTKKKTAKADPLSVYDNERLVSNFDKQQDWPKIEKGNHLTVYTYSDGTTRLEWDDEALLKEVQAAILNTQGETNGKTKQTRKSK